MVAVPDVGGVSPRRARMLVVFPEPLAPRKTVTRPRRISADSPSTAVTAPYRLVSRSKARGIMVHSCRLAGPLRCGPVLDVPRLSPPAPARAAALQPGVPPRPAGTQRAALAGVWPGPPAVCHRRGPLAAIAV